MALFFIYPFGIDGDLAAVPNDTQVSGSVSYQQGFPIAYEQDLATVSTARPIPRTQFNQIMFDITDNIQQYQTLGTPMFITTGDNEGTPWPYDIYARVRYDDGGGFKTYESLETANVALPSDLTKWRIISNNLEGTQSGTVIDWAGLTAPAGYLKCDGSAILRASYPSLYANIVHTESGTLINTQPTITGLADTSIFYVGMPVEGSGIPSSTTILTIDSGTQVTMTNNATIGHATPVSFFPWGEGDGTTTFNVPDLRRKTTIGQGGSGTVVIGNSVGQTGGEESHTQTEAELATHSHPGSTFNYTAINTAGGGSPTVGSDPGATPHAVIVAADGSSTPFNVMQPSAVMYKCIKT